MLELLSSIPLFENLQKEELDIISRYCHYKQFQTGKVLFYEGERADKLYIIVSGEVEIWADFKQKDRDLLALSGKGEIVGEMALIDDLPRSATLIAQNDCEVYTISQEDFSEILTQCPSVALLIVKSISAIVRKSNQNFVATLRQRNKDLEKTYQELIETQKRLNREEKLSTLGKFSSMILHDIKNPVSVIKSYSDLALMRYGSELGDLEKFFLQIKKETTRLHSLANELLDFSRGDISLNLSLISPSDLVNEVLEELEPVISARQLEVTLELDSDIRLLLDKERIQRVIHNLLENARKALPVRGKIWIRTRNVKKVLELSIEDNGMGMSEEVQKHIFEPFYTQSSQGGTGLGMMIARNIIEAHNGSIDVESTEEKGTKILLNLPLTTHWSG